MDRGRMRRARHQRRGLTARVSRPGGRARKQTRSSRTQLPSRQRTPVPSRQRALVPSRQRALVPSRQRTLVPSRQRMAPRHHGHRRPTGRRCRRQRTGRCGRGHPAAPRSRRLSRERRSRRESTARQARGQPLLRRGRQCPPPRPSPRARRRTNTGRRRPQVPRDRRGGQHPQPLVRPRRGPLASSARRPFARRDRTCQRRPPDPHPRATRQSTQCPTMTNRPWSRSGLRSRGWRVNTAVAKRTIDANEDDHPAMRGTPPKTISRTCKAMPPRTTTGPCEATPPRTTTKPYMARLRGRPPSRAWHANEDDHQAVHGTPTRTTTKPCEATPGRTTTRLCQSDGRQPTAIAMTHVSNTPLTIRLSSTPTARHKVTEKCC
jgi:hypothetical protein